MIDETSYVLSLPVLVQKSIVSLVVYIISSMEGKQTKTFTQMTETHFSVQIENLTLS
jgi:hypothetical protein